MPELPEVETVCRGIAPTLKGKLICGVVVRRFDLRLPIPKNFVARVKSQRVLSVKRRGKYILIELSGQNSIICHLGMSGRLTVHKTGQRAPLAGPHDHVDLVTENGDSIRFNDPRRFGLITLVNTNDIMSHKLFRNMGPEPLSEVFNPITLIDSLSNKEISIKEALLNQQIVAGLGNIYVCESLYRSGISPKRLAKNVRGKRAFRLVYAIKDVLQGALEAGGSSIKDHINPNGQLGYFQTTFNVYSKEGKPCSNADCDSRVCCGIKRIVQGGRSTFYCSYKQR